MITNDSNVICFQVVPDVIRIPKNTTSWIVVINYLGVEEGLFMGTKGCIRVYHCFSRDIRIVP